MKMKMFYRAIVVLILTLFLFTGCGNNSSKEENKNNSESTIMSETSSEEIEDIEATTETQTPDNSETVENSENTKNETTEVVEQTSPQQKPNATPAQKPQNEEFKFTETIYEESYIAYTLYSAPLRDKPSNSGKILTTLVSYDKIEVIGFCDTLPWNKVIYNGIIGYVPYDINDKSVLSASIPEYGYSFFTSGTIEDSRLSMYLQMEGGRKYWVWIANVDEEHGGHWDSRYEFSKGNSCSQELLIEFLDKSCTFVPTGDQPCSDTGNYYYGQYDGEIYDYGKEYFGEEVIFVIYLNGGPLKN